VLSILTKLESIECLKVGDNDLFDANGGAPCAQAALLLTLFLGLTNVDLLEFIYY